MSTRSYCLRVVVCFASLVLAACGDDPQVPTASTPVANATLTGRVAVVLQEAPSVRVTDQKGKNIKGLLVRWRVTSGGGRVSSDTARTDANGVATSGGWVLGTTSGVQTLQATAEGIAPTTFTAQALPGPLTSLLVAGNASPVAPVATTLTTIPAVRAEDQYGNGIPDLPVTFAITQGNGSITGTTQVTSALGVATLGSWTLGTISGAQRVLATAVDAGAGTSASVSINATAQPGAPVRLTKIAGDNQLGTFNSAVGVPPGVRVVDSFGNGVGNVVVTFTPGPNSGAVANATVTSDPANGTAFVGAWTLSDAPTQTLVASATSLPNGAVTFTATASATQFDIDVRFVGSVANPLVRQAFLTAAAKWRTVIVGDLQRTIVNSAAGLCDSWIPAINETINDIVIFARVAPIDSAGGANGNILGQAGPCAVNSGTRLTAYGLMEFDEFDLEGLVADGSLADVIIHEMGHVLGIGTLWNFNRSLLIGAGGSDPFFQGTAGRAQFAALNTATYSGLPVPVENTGGSGTRDSHWRESILRSELMTGFLNRGSNPLSRISVGSLQDLGYTVNLAAADGYSLTAALYSFPFGAGTSRTLHNDVKTLPLFSIDAAGRASRVRQD
jgi:Leishmanolysin